MLNDSPWPCGWRQIWHPLILSIAGGVIVYCTCNPSWQCPAHPTLHPATLLQAPAILYMQTLSHPCNLTWVNLIKSHWNQIGFDVYLQASRWLLFSATGLDCNLLSACFPYSTLSFSSTQLTCPNPHFDGVLCFLGKPQICIHIQLNLYIMMKRYALSWSDLTNYYRFSLEARHCKPPPFALTYGWSSYSVQVEECLS